GLKGRNPWRRNRVSYVVKRNHGVDKVVLVGKGIFLVRFKAMDHLRDMLNGEHYLFDSKPLIVKPCNLDMEILKKPVIAIPIWVQLPKLDPGMGAQSDGF
ncbi:Bifunctional protein PyrR, partial [Bienertia sinuspersici]